METVGDRLKKLRLARKLSQEQVAKAVGVKQGSYTQLERGVSKTPRSANLAKYARLYEVNPEWLMTGKGSQQPVEALGVEETDLVTIYRSLSPEGRQYVLARAKSVQRDEQDVTGQHRRFEDTAPGKSRSKPKH